MTVWKTVIHGCPRDNLGELVHCRQSVRLVPSALKQPRLLAFQQPRRNGPLNRIAADDHQRYPERNQFGGILPQRLFAFVFAPATTS
jgi:hypothetical protein